MLKILSIVMLLMYLAFATAETRPELRQPLDNEELEERVAGEGGAPRHRVDDGANGHLEQLAIRYFEAVCLNRFNLHLDSSADRLAPQSNCIIFLLHRIV